MKEKNSSGGNHWKYVEFEDFLTFLSILGN